MPSLLVPIARLRITAPLGVAEAGTIISTEKAMADNDAAEKIRQLTEENQKMKVTLQEIERAIEPFLQKHKPSQPRSFEQQLLHDVRNILNELGLLRALVPSEDESGPTQ